MGATSTAGSRSARACDYCIKTRARWYCAADDAFLCQSCDTSVHSANPVARRHQRVRLKTALLKHSLEVSVPRWHRGFCRKARTPRQKKIAAEEATRVPGNSGEGEEESPVKNEAQLLYQVPNFDDGEKMADSTSNVLDDFLHSDMDLDEFAADVESLLGKGLENSTFDISELGNFDSERVIKVEAEAIAGKSSDHQPQPPSNHNSGSNSPITARDGENSNDLHDSNKVFLKLNYDGVLSSWGSKKSPWTTGERPDPNSAHCWQPDCTGCCGKMHGYGVTGIAIGNVSYDGGREARVSRYREKRRTRLFSKKIRYEVRKLNAEKRPRMKGRFIKRSNSVTL